jgi:ABC-2 type transport system permease protein
VKAEFANYIDTVGRDAAIRKSILLTTSGRTRTVAPPVVISLEEAREAIPAELFTAGELPVAVLLEGTFRSAFTNRMTESIIGEAGRNVITESKPTKMIIIADGDIIRNEISWRNGVAEPLTLGLDRYTMQTFGNKDFLVNCINYLVDDNGLTEMRSREIKPRLLDQSRIRSQRGVWQLINTVAPVILIILAGAAYYRLKQRHYNAVK